MRPSYVDGVFFGAALVGACLTTGADRACAIGVLLFCGLWDVFGYLRR